MGKADQGVGIVLESGSEAFRMVSGVSKERGLGFRV